eukprot:CAMPEP_0174231670 /NCGR_PEP_ID=MMETSP0417-20130205/2150_1 /TAXON_ID=242541 /ORGANISM="Mayorella sp, Strain BSH-02190019" /LENGTH=719 /DNA_ID=CAMNT_0015309595 /DNA_START=180 /DNA_END=2340 /DNA_ORIENTATION=+
MSNFNFFFPSSASPSSTSSSSSSSGASSSRSSQQAQSPPLTSSVLYTNNIVSTSASSSLLETNPQSPSPLHIMHPTTSSNVRQAREALSHVESLLYAQLSALEARQSASAQSSRIFLSPSNSSSQLSPYTPSLSTTLSSTFPSTSTSSTSTSSSSSPCSLSQTISTCAVCASCGGSTTSSGTVSSPVTDPSPTTSPAASSTLSSPSRQTSSSRSFSTPHGSGTVLSSVASTPITKGGDAGHTPTKRSPAMRTIQQLTAPTAAVVVQGDGQQMVWDPVTLRWRGNEEDVFDFPGARGEIRQLSVPTQPEVLDGDGCTMKFDPVTQRWDPLENGSSEDIPSFPDENTPTADMAIFEVTNEMMAGFQSSQNEHARTLGGWFREANNAREFIFDPTVSDLQELTVAFLVRIARNGNAGHSDRPFTVISGKRNQSLKRGDLSAQFEADEDDAEMLDETELQDAFSSQSEDEDEDGDEKLDLRARMERRQQQNLEEDHELPDFTALNLSSPHAPLPGAITNLNNRTRIQGEWATAEEDVDSDVDFPDGSDEETLQLRQDIHEDDASTLFANGAEENNDDAENTGGDWPDSGWDGDQTDLSVLELADGEIDLDDQTGEFELTLVSQAAALASDEQNSYAGPSEEEQDDDIEIDVSRPLKLRGLVNSSSSSSSPDSESESGSASDSEELSLAGTHHEDDEVEDELGGFDDPEFAKFEASIVHHGNEP